jgi:hypothetical protein
MEGRMGSRFGLLQGEPLSSGRRLRLQIRTSIKRNAGSSGGYGQYSIRNREWLAIGLVDSQAFLNEASM